MDREKALRKRQGARLRLARKATYRSARAAAQENGWPESSVRAHENGTRTIGIDDAERYAQRYRALGAAVTARSILFDDGAASAQADDKPDMAPLISWVPASAMADVGDVAHPADAPMIPIPDLHKGDWIALRVQGDSMDKVAPEGAIIVVNRLERKLMSGKFYVVANRGEPTFKRFVDKPTKMLMPFSNNSAHMPIIPGKNFVVIGPCSTGHAGSVAMRIIFIVFSLVILLAIVGLPGGPRPETQPALSPEQKAANEVEERKFQQAVIAVGTLKASMKNPKSFTLEEALRMDDGTICVTYRATNSFNAIVPGQAVIASKGDFVTTGHTDFTARWNARCGGKRGTDIRYIRMAL